MRAHVSAAIGIAAFMPRSSTQNAAVSWSRVFVAAGLEEGRARMRASRTKCPTSSRIRSWARQLDADEVPAMSISHGCAGSTNRVK
jgi:hypothetical protein